jgi:hypothetical protein
MVMGETVFGRIWTGASLVKKCDVHPLSAIATVLVDFVGGAEIKAVGGLLRLLALIFGGPRCQTAAGGRGARRVRGLFMVTLLHPPDGFLNVAVVTCPSARLVQVALVWFLLNPNPCVQQ